MRKILIICFIFLVNVQEALSQINSGTWVLDGASSFSYTDGSSTSVSLQNLNFALRTGIFAGENLAIGPLFGYTETTQSQFGGTITESTAIFGGFLRYYIGGKVFLGVGYTSVSLLTKYGGTLGSSTIRDGTTTQIPLELGFAGFVAHNLAIEPTLIYIIGENSNTFSIGLGFGLYLGRGRKDETTQ